MQFNEQLAFKGVILALAIALISGCTAAKQYFPEAEKNQSFSIEAFRAGTFRLDLPGAWSGGEIAAYRYVVLGDELPPGRSLPNAVLDALVADQNGSDAGYYWLAWAAENMGYSDGAYEYYRVAKLLYDYNRIPSEQEGIWDTALADGDEVYFSECGYKYREWGGNEAIPCIKNMRGAIVAAIERLERTMLEGL